MLIGTDPPEWAANLMDHWVSIKDTDVKVFVFYADYLEPDNKVRIVGTTMEKALTEINTGKIEPGIFAAFVEEEECFIVETPEGLEAWTAKEVAAAQEAEGALCVKPE